MTTQRVSLPAYVTFRQVDNEGVLVDLKKSVYFGLNEVGAQILTLSQDDATVREIAEKLAKLYPDADASEVARDVQGFVAQLADKGLLQLS